MSQQPTAVTCPHCRAQFAVQDPRLVGRTVKCPGCTQPFVVSVGAPAPQQQRQPQVQQPQQRPAQHPQQQPAQPTPNPMADPLADPLAADPLGAGPLGGADPLTAPAVSPLQGQRPGQRRPGYQHRGKKKGQAAWLKPTLIGGGVLLGLLMLVGLVSLLLNNGSASRGGDGNVVNMTWLPADTEVLTFVDVRALVNSNFVRKQIENDPNAQRAMEQMREQTGIGPEDIESVTVGASQSNSQSGLAVIRLSKDFDPAKLPNAQTSEVNGEQIYSSGNMSVMTPDPRTLVIGPPAAIRTAAERGPEKKRFPKFDFVNASQDMFFCIVPNDIASIRQQMGNGSKSLTNNPMAPAEFKTAVQAIANHASAFAGGGEMRGDNLNLSVQVSLDDGGSTSEVTTGINAALTELREQYPQFRGLVAMQSPDGAEIIDELIESLGVNKSGDSVALSLSLPMAKMQQVAESQAKGGGMGMPSPGMLGGFKNPLEGLGSFGGLGDGIFGSSGNSGASGLGRSQDLALSNKLKQIGIALHNYHAVHKSIPSANNNGLSWRVHLLPYLEQSQLYERFNLDEPWDSPTNRALLSEMPDIYQVGQGAGPGKTAILGVASAGGVFADPQTPAKFRDIVDGMSNTAGVVVVADGAAVEWTKPVDYNSGPPAALRLFNDRYMVLLMDGAVRPISMSWPAANWRNLFNKGDGNIIDFN